MKMQRLSGKSRVLFMVLGLVLAITLTAACSPAPTTTPTAASGLTAKAVVITGGIPGSSAEAHAQNFAQLITKVTNGKTVASVVPGTSQANQWQLVASGSANIAIHFNPPEAYNLYNGLAAEAHQKSSDLRTLWPSVPVWYFFLALQSAKANTTADLKGLTIATTLPGSTTSSMLPAFLKAAGYDPVKDVKIKMVGASAVNEVRNGTSDVGFLAQGFPAAAYTELELSKPIKFLDMSPDVIKKVNADNFGGMPVYSPAILKKGDFFTTTTRDFPVATVATFAIASKSADPEMIYQLTKMFWENKAQLDSNWAVAKQINKDLIPSINGPQWPIHEGAMRYYKEKGWKVN